MNSRPRVNETTINSPPKYALMIYPLDTIESAKGGRLYLLIGVAVEFDGAINDDWLREISTGKSARSTSQF